MSKIDEETECPLSDCAILCFSMREKDSLFALPAV